MSKNVNGIEDLCLDTPASFRFIEYQNGNGIIEIVSDDNNVFERIRNGSYIKFWNEEKTKMGIAVYGETDNELFPQELHKRYVHIIVATSGFAPSGSEVFYTHSMYNKGNFKFLNQYTTLQDIIEYFGNPSDVDNDFVIFLNNSGNTKDVNITPPFNSRFTLMSPTEKNKIKHLPFKISTTHSFEIDDSPKTMFFTQLDESVQIHKINVSGITSDNLTFDFDLEITRDVITVKNNHRGFVFNLGFRYRVDGDNIRYLQMVATKDKERVENPEIGIIYITTEHPELIKYDVNPVPNSITYPTFSQDYINIQPAFLMADTLGNYVTVSNVADGGFYSLTVYEGSQKYIPASTHGRGLFPVVNCYAVESNSYRQLETSVQVNDNGDVEVVWNGGVSIAQPVRIIIR